MDQNMRPEAFRLSPTNPLLDLRHLEGGLILMSGQPIILSLSLYFASWRLLQGDTVLLIDGANTFDPYLVGEIARRTKRPPRELLERIFVARAFTCHQMETLITERLEEAMEKVQSRIIILSGLLNTFYDEDVPTLEALRLLRKSLRKLKTLGERHLILALCPDPPARVSQRKSFLNLLKSQAQKVIETKHQGNNLLLHERGKEIAHRNHRRKKV
jgi:hypothetical protein